MPMAWCSLFVLKVPLKHQQTNLLTQLPSENLVLLVKHVLALEMDECMMLQLIIHLASGVLTVWYLLWMFAVKQSVLRATQAQCSRPNVCEVSMFRRWCRYFLGIRGWTSISTGYRHRRRRALSSPLLTVNVVWLYCLTTSTMLISCLTVFSVYEQVSL